eukprot:858548-Pelagomonas_calceolata.AAC.1
MGWQMEIPEYLDERKLCWANQKECHGGQSSSSVGNEYYGLRERPFSLGLHVSIFGRHYEFLRARSPISSDEKLVDKPCSSTILSVSGPWLTSASPGFARYSKLLLKRLCLSTCKGSFAPVQPLKQCKPGIPLMLTHACGGHGKHGSATDAFLRWQGTRQEELKPGKLAP